MRLGYLGAPAVRRERWLVIDADVADADILLAGAASDTRILRLDPGEGLARIAAEAARCGPIAELHLIAHGRPGAVLLGGGEISAETFAAHAPSFASLRSALAGGTLLLWCCDVAAGDAGEALLRRIETATGARVVAASGTIGAASRGGAWTLADGAELFVPPVASTALEGWLHALGIFDIQIKNPEYEGNAGVVFISAAIRRFGDTSSNEVVTVSIGPHPALADFSSADQADFVGGDFPVFPVFFSPDEHIKFVNIPIQGDLIVEPTELFFATLINPMSDNPDIVSSVSGDPARGEIKNDDPDFPFRLPAVTTLTPAPDEVVRYDGGSTVASLDNSTMAFANALADTPNGIGTGRVSVVLDPETGDGFDIDGEHFGEFFGESICGGSVVAAGELCVIVGAPGGGPDGEGCVYIYSDLPSGAPAPEGSLFAPAAAPAGATVHRIVGEFPDAGFGGSVAARDFNGDGIDDVFVGAQGADITASNAGAAYVVFGGFETPTFDVADLDGSNGFRLNGPATFTGSLGASVAGADINGDGFADLIAGAPGARPSNLFFAGAVYVVFGGESGFDAEMDVSDLDGSNGFVINGVAANAAVGTSVASAGDVNGDGIEDIIIGAPGFNRDGLYGVGAAYVVFGSRDGFGASLDLSGLDGTNGFRIDGISSHARTGASVAGGGDVNGDGFDDVIVGAANEAPNGYGSGSAFVVFGRPSAFFSAVESLDNPDSDQVWRLDGGAAYDHAGWTVASAGDVNGDGLDDVLTGAFGANSYTGAAFLVYGRKAPDPVLRVGSQASQTLVGSDFGDVLIGLGGNDRLIGHDGGDYLDGGEGDDTLTGGLCGCTDIFVWSTGGGTDTITDFQIGIDLIDLTGALGVNSFADLVIVQNGDNAEIVLGSGLILLGIDALDLSAGDFVFAGSAGTAVANDDHWFVSRGTAARLPSLSVLGNDSGFFLPLLESVGGAQNGSVSVDGNGVITFTATASEVPATGSFTYVMSDGPDTDEGAVTITFVTTSNAIDVLDVATAADEFSFINGFGGDDVLTGGAGADTLLGASGDDMLEGGEGRDKLLGGAGDDELSGGAGNDALVGGAGGDTLDGGDGVDLVSYGNAQSGVTANLADPGQNTGDAFGDTYVSIENLRGSQYDDVLTGDSGNNRLIGDLGDDELNGGDGNDVLYGGAGADALNGGDGIDTAIYTLALGVTASLLDPGTNAGDAFGDTYDSIENLTGSLYEDSLTGDNGDNTLNGGLGDDYLYGEGGNDLLIGGSGADYLDGGDGVDTVSYASSQFVGVYVSLAAGIAAVGDAQGDVLIDIENLIGTRFDDFLEGDGGDNVLKGGAGIDFLSYENASGGVVVSLAIKTAQDTGGAGHDTISGFENLIGSAAADQLTGNSSANFIMGGDGDDIIKGGGGNDVLEGGLGDDTLRGGADSDLFVFAINAFAGGHDTVMDYAGGVDNFHLTGTGVADFDALLALMHQSGNHVVIDFDPDNSLTIRNTTIATLTANQGDFII